MLDDARLGDALSPFANDNLPPAGVPRGAGDSRLFVRGGLSGWQRRRLTDFIDAHLACTVRVAELARLAGLSPYHFARAFKVSFGAPPHRYHLARRVARAKALLRGGETVTAVALEVGFAETSSFSAAFRRHSGIPPSRYRDVWRRLHERPRPRYGRA